MSSFKVFNDTTLPNAGDRQAYAIYLVAPPGASYTEVYVTGADPDTVRPIIAQGDLSIIIDSLLDSDLGVTVQRFNANTVIDSDYVRTDENFSHSLKAKLDSIATGAQVNVKPDWIAGSGDVSEILNKPTLGTAALGNIGVEVQPYNADTVIDSDYVRTDENFTSVLKTKLDSIATGAEVNVQADWTAVSGDAVIINKPTLGTAAAQNVEAFATAAQGALADSAVQPDEIDDFETTAQLIARETETRKRENHTGEQPINTITGLQAALDARVTTGSPVSSLTWSSANW